jgi:hypothetical protein
MSRLLIGIIYVYRWIISPLLTPRCRFEPSCSKYAIHALESHGVMHGLWLIGKRLLRCQPYTDFSQKLGPSFGYDPVPEPAVAKGGD